jgi:hypothetical protein
VPRAGTIIIARVGKLKHPSMAAIIWLILSILVSVYSSAT